MSLSFFVKGLAIGLAIAAPVGAIGVTILSFAAVFAGLGIGGTGGDYGAAALMVLGVFSGSALWWLILSSGVGLFRARFGLRGLLWVNRLSGLIITGFGAAVLISLLAGQPARWIVLT